MNGGIKKDVIFNSGMALYRGEWTKKIHAETRLFWIRGFARHCIFLWGIWQEVSFLAWLTSVAMQI